MYWVFVTSVKPGGFMGPRLVIGDLRVQRLTAENATLKQRLRDLSASSRTLEERLQAARSNNRFLDKRIAGLEAQLLNTHIST